jgi:ankyrin repeat protein
METTQTFFQLMMDGDAGQVAKLVHDNPALVNARTPAGVPGVLFALYVGQPAIGQFLLEQQAEVDVFTAAAYGLTPRLRAMLDQQPEQVNWTALDGFSPLGLAAFFGREEAARLLVERGAAIDQPSANAQRVTPLHSAAASRSLEIARLLIERGADVGARQAGDFVPLHAAAQNGQLELVRLLLQRGADPSALTAEGRTPLFYAREGGHTAVVGLLLAAGAAE